MTVEYVEIKGHDVNFEELKLPKARDLAKSLASGRVPFVSLVKCLSEDEPIYTEKLILDIEVERPQRVLNDIRRVERVAVVFPEHDAYYPDVLALRVSFPKVPHLNARHQEIPKSLCLYEEPYAEVKLRWTPLSFIERIREWLKLTALGTLHGADQPLEGILPRGRERLIYPPDLLTALQGQEHPIFHIRCVGGEGETTLIAIRDDRVQNNIAHELEGLLMVFECEPRLHGAIHRLPSNLAELSEMVASGGLDLPSAIKANLRSLFRQGKHKENLKKRLWLFISYGLQREAGGPVEARGTWAFVIHHSSLEEVGKALGIWDISDGRLGYLMSDDPDKVGSELAVSAIEPVASLTRTTAGIFSGESNPYEGKIVGIGMGALGSQVFENLFRSGFGQWTLVDNDVLLPHNFTKHALFTDVLGWPKALAMAEYSNVTLSEKQGSSYIIADVFNPSPEKLESIKTSIESADIVVDMSAAISVARAVALDYRGSGRRVSMFLSPTGRDLVLLAEPLDRSVRLDELEMQYYRYLISEPVLASHLTQVSERARYARSCRDLTSTISQDYFATHSGIASRQIRRLSQDSDARIQIWRLDEDDGSVKTWKYEVSKSNVHKVGEWEVIVDQSLLSKCSDLRLNRLPNETGGVLIGAYDFSRKRIYVIDNISSPLDSQEEPASFVRGANGLIERLSEIESRTMGSLRYIGEWHSHPNGCLAKASGTDVRALQKLAEELSVESVPATMIIVGDEGKYDVLVQEV